jgi:acyl dehydratase
VLDFHRCAMLPMRSDASRPGHTDDLDAISAELDADRLLAGVEGWDLAGYRAAVPGEHAGGMNVGARYAVETGDTVSCAPELVRLTLNVAGAHSDPAAGGRGRRLVYGGHTIGVALAQTTRLIPNLVTVAGWRACDHLAPVFEGDVLRSAVTVESVEPANQSDAALVELHVETVAERADRGEAGPEREPVLDWRLVTVMAS